MAADVCQAAKRCSLELQVEREAVRNSSRTSSLRPSSFTLVYGVSAPRHHSRAALPAGFNSLEQLLSYLELSFDETDRREAVCIHPSKTHMTVSSLRTFGVTALRSEFPWAPSPHNAPTSMMQKSSSRLPLLS